MKYQIEFTKILGNGTAIVEAEDESEAEQKFHEGDWIEEYCDEEYSADVVSIEEMK
jgi:hypothetical protein